MESDSSSSQRRISNLSMPLASFATITEMSKVLQDTLSQDSNDAFDAESIKEQKSENNINDTTTENIIDTHTVEQNTETVSMFSTKNQKQKNEEVFEENSEEEYFDSVRNIEEIESTNSNDFPIDQLMQNESKKYENIGLSESDAKHAEDVGESPNENLNDSETFVSIDKFEDAAQGIGHANTSDVAFKNVDSNHIEVNETEKTFKDSKIDASIEIIEDANKGTDLDNFPVDQVIQNESEKAENIGISGSDAKHVSFEDIDESPNDPEYSKIDASFDNIDSNLTEVIKSEETTKDSKIDASIEIIEDPDIVADSDIQNESEQAENIGISQSEDIDESFNDNTDDSKIVARGIGNTPANTSDVSFENVDSNLTEVIHTEETTKDSKIDASMEIIEDSDIVADSDIQNEPEEAENINISESNAKHAAFEDIDESFNDNTNDSKIDVSIDNIEDSAQKIGNAPANTSDGAFEMWIAILLKSLKQKKLSKIQKLMLQSRSLKILMMALIWLIFL